MSRGRPKKYKSREHVYHIRLSHDDVYMLDYLVEKAGKSKPDVLRDMIRTNYNLTRFRGNLVDDGSDGFVEPYMAPYED